MHGLPKALRIRKSKEFDAVFESRKVFRSRSVSFYYWESSASPALGVVCSKKKLGQAVRRNKFKRINKEIFRLNQGGIIGVRVVVVPLRSFSKVHLDRWFDELIWNWECYLKFLSKR